MSDGMSSRKAAAACLSMFLVPISKTMLLNGVNKGKVNTPEKPGRPTHFPEDAEPLPPLPQLQADEQAEDQAQDQAVEQAEE